MRYVIEHCEDHPEGSCYWSTADDLDEQTGVLRQRIVFRCRECDAILPHETEPTPTEEV